MPYNTAKKKKKEKRKKQWGWKIVTSEAPPKFVSNLFFNNAARKRRHV